MALNRRDFLQNAAKAALFPTAAVHLPVLGQAVPTAAKPDLALRIESATLDIGPGVSIRTIAYNGQVPGPTLRLKEGVPVAFDVTNATPNEDIVHWHGLAISSIPDGAIEEGSPIIKPGKTLRYSFTPKPAGTRWYHTHASAGSDLSLGTYSGQFGFLLVEDGREKGDWDREVTL